MRVSVVIHRLLQEVSCQYPCSLLDRCPDSLQRDAGIRPAPAQDRDRRQAQRRCWSSAAPSFATAEAAGARGRRARCSTGWRGSARRSSPSKRCRVSNATSSSGSSRFMARPTTAIAPTWRRSSARPGSRFRTPPLRSPAPFRSGRRSRHRRSAGTWPCCFLQRATPLRLWCSGSACRKANGTRATASTLRFSPGFNAPGQSQRKLLDRRIARRANGARARVPDRRP